MSHKCTIGCIRTFTCSFLFALYLIYHFFIWYCYSFFVIFLQFCHKNLLNYELACTHKLSERVKCERGDFTADSCGNVAKVWRPQPHDLKPFACNAICGLSPKSCLRGRGRGAGGYCNCEGTIIHKVTRDIRGCAKRPF